MAFEACETDRIEQLRERLRLEREEAARQAQMDKVIAMSRAARAARGES
jgi:hypothetical protein